MPSTNLLAMTGAELAFDEAAQAYLPVELPPNVHAAGAVAGRSLRRRSGHARPVGGPGGGGGRGSRRGRRAHRSAGARGARPPETRSILPPEASALDGKQFGCLCMDVTNKELKKAVVEGFDSMELLKRYTTITMGPCQGKACMLSSQRLCARATGSSFAETKPTTSRPPWTPVDLGTLAGVASDPAQGDHDPRTARHGRGDVHVGGRLATAAPLLDAGGRGRRRPQPASGVIDVSTLGKFRVKGPAGGGPARAAVPEPVRGPGGRTDPVRRHVERRGRDPGRRRRRPSRRRRVLRDGDHGEHRGARTVDHVVARGLAAGRADLERHRSVRGGEPGGAAAREP